MTVDDRPNRRLLDLMTGYWRTQAVGVAARLGVADALAGGRCGSGPLADRLGVDRDGLHRLLTYLVAIEVLDGDEESGYATTEVGELLRTDVPGGMHHYARIYGAEFYDVWGNLETAVRNGGSAFSATFGTELFPYLASHPEASLSYERAMVAGDAFFTAIDSAVDLSGAGTVVDVGGGHGALLRHLLRSHPHLNGILFDRPQVIEEAAAQALLADAGDRCRLVSGDIFGGAPEGGDVYALSRVLHCFADPEAAKVLASCRSAMREGARLLVVERMLGEGTPLAAGYNLHMLAVMGSGRERTRAEFAALLADAGFRLETAHVLPLDAYVLVAVAV